MECVRDLRPIFRPCPRGVHRAARNAYFVVSAPKRTRPAVIPNVIRVETERQRVVAVSGGLNPIRLRQLVRPQRRRLFAVHVKCALAARSVGDQQVDPVTLQRNALNHQRRPIRIAAPAQHHLVVRTLVKAQPPSAVIPTPLLRRYQSRLSVRIGSVEAKPSRDGECVAIAELRRIRRAKVGRPGRAVDPCAAQNARRADVLILTLAARRRRPSVSRRVRNVAARLAHMPDAAVARPNARGILDNSPSSPVISVKPRANAIVRKPHPDNGLAVRIPRLDFIRQLVARGIREEQVLVVARRHEVRISEAVNRFREAHGDGNVRLHRGFITDSA